MDQKKNIKEEILKLPEIYPHPIFKVTTDPNIKTWSFKTINLYENTEETLWKEFQHVFNQKQNLSKKRIVVEMKNILKSEEDEILLAREQAKIERQNILNEYPTEIDDLTLDSFE